ARRWNVRFHSLRPRRPHREPHANLQLWARDVRYRFFARTAAAHGYDHIAVGHTVDDRAENVAAAVIDAAGTFALSGIPPVRGQLIRPLFGCARRDIETYLRRRRIPCRRDSSNRSLRYRRNHVRKNVLPQWTAMNPSVVEGLARLGEQLWLQRRYLEEAAVDVLQRAVRNGGEHRLTLDASALREYDRCLDPFVLRAMIERIGLALVPRPATVARFEALRRETNGAARTVEQGDLTITRSKGMIAVTKRSARRRPGRQCIAVPRSGLSVSDLDGKRLRTDVCETDPPRRSDDTREAYLDLARLRGPLFLRCPCPGDRYRPIGLGGSKKLTDLLSERAVPAFDRENIPVLADRSGILWPIGCPIAHRARITGGTRRILRVRVV
ncbi:MAG TPA: tRNA lysidine(34) synthetase TilS, partial [Acidobacteriota bacterium]|nr:tRNA lysidine(34) synthetase TilS [Acidobacteriota bacterium]